MSLRELLIAIGAVVILGIVIDGVRRMRRTRREAAAIASGMGADDIADPDGLDEHNPELPNGGSRPIDREELESRGYFTTAKSGPRFANPPQKPTRPIVADCTKQSADAGSDNGYESAIQQTDHAGDEDLSNPENPIDHSAVEPESGDAGFSARDLQENSRPDEPLTAFDEEPLTASAADHESARKKAPDTWERGPEEISSDVHEAHLADHEPAVPGAQAESPVAKDHPAQSSVENTAAATSTSDPDRPKAGANRPDAREVLVINVLAAQDHPFDGNSLRKLFEGCGLEFGDMAIYHRHEGNDTRTPVQFSVANALEPGTFRQQDLDGMKTPGISFFMSLPGPSDFMQAFEFMLETAQCVVKNLGGELKDERRSVMTRQTIEHCRQRIREFERKRLSERVT